MALLILVEAATRKVALLIMTEAAMRKVALLVMIEAAMRKRAIQVTTKATSRVAINPAELTPTVATVTRTVEKRTSNQDAHAP